MVLLPIPMATILELLTKLVKEMAEVTHMVMAEVLPFLLDQPAITADEKVT